MIKTIAFALTVLLPAIASPVFHLYDGVDEASGDRILFLFYWHDGNALSKTEPGSLEANGIAFRCFKGKTVFAATPLERLQPGDRVDVVYGFNSNEEAKAVWSWQANVNSAFSPFGSLMLDRAIKAESLRITVGPAQKMTFDLEAPRNDLKEFKRKCADWAAKQ
jgi:hypothetical protein